MQAITVDPDENVLYGVQHYPEPGILMVDLASSVD